MQCILPQPLPADDHDAETDAYFEALADEALSAFDDDAAQSTRDDGMLFHGRLPCEDTDAFNPCVITHRERTPILPPRGGDPIGTGLPVCGASL